MTLSYEELCLAVLRGERTDGQLQQFAPSMAVHVQSCDAPLPDGLCMVTSKSPMTYKEAVQTIARCWHRELKYDMVPFDTWEYQKRDSSGRNFNFRKPITTDDNARSFFWHCGKPRNWQTIGACTFRLRQDRCGSYWGLQWIWFHPQERRSGHLTKAWPFFRSMFGVFLPEPPLSVGLATFLRKMNYGKDLKEEYERRE